MACDSTLNVGIGDGEPPVVTAMLGSITTRTDNTRSSSIDIDYLPTLAFELQFCILSQIPVIQLFTLRRVSHAWNNMLKNPILLEAINNQLPYLTSAPDLISRMKRRMRMITSEPVWIKTITEVFPWTNKICADLENDIGKIAKFWKGFAVFLKRSEGFDMSLPNIHDPVIQVRIEGLGTEARSQFPVVEIDVLADFMKAYPAQYHKYFELGYRGEALGVPGFSIEDDKVVVFLEGGQRFKIEEAETEPKCIFFFIYSIPTGNLVQHICRITNPSSIGTECLYYRLCRASKTHFMALFTTYSNIQVPDRYRSKSFVVHWIFIYTLHDGSLVQLIRIGPSDSFKCDFDEGDAWDPHGGDFYGWNLQDCIFQFDHLERIWFPEVQPPQAFTVSYFGPGLTTERSRLCVPIINFPRVACGEQKWTIVPTAPPGLEPDMSLNINFPSEITCKDSETDGTVDESKEFTKYSKGFINIYDSRLSMFHFKHDFVTNYPLGVDHQHRFLNVPIMNPDQDVMSNNAESTEPVWLTTMNIQNLRTINSLDQEYQPPNIDFIPKAESRTYLVADAYEDPRLYHPETATWGFVAFQVRRWSSHPTTGTDREAFVNFCVLPLHDDDVYYHDCLQRPPMHMGDECAAASSAETEDADEIFTLEQVPNMQYSLHDQVDDELRGINRRAVDFGAPTPYSISWFGSKVLLKSSSGRPQYADDGLVCWGVDVTNHFPDGRRSRSRELLLVCYEEAWAL